MSRSIGPLLLLAFAGASAPAVAAGVQGRWLTGDRNALVEIGPCGAALCGKVLRVLDPKAPALDVNNPAPRLRTRPIVGIDVLSGFKPSGNEWRGQIYDPKGGKTYKSVIRLNPNGTLNVKGCIFFLCRGQTWTRVR